jgi:hypothetical protein
MSLWVMIALLGLIKLPIAALMFWIPFREDEAMRSTEAPSSSEDDGGSRVLPGGPLDPHPHRPGIGPRPRRRGPHGDTAPGAPGRVRGGARATRVARLSGAARVGARGRPAG